MGKLNGILAKQANEEEQALRDLLSANIRKYRHRRNLSQFSLATKADLSTNFIADIEAGNTWVSSMTLIKLAKALEIEVYELLRPDKTGASLGTDEDESRIGSLMEQLSLDVTTVLREAVDKAIERGRSEGEK